jgi:hypothetical protein
MKKLCLMIFAAFCCYAALSQNNPPANANIAIRPGITKTIKIIPSSKAVLIRKDVVQLKGQLSQFSDSVTITKKQIDDEVNKMKSDLDQMSEMGEMESLRLQMAMDRLSKMMATLSNLMKKISDTAQGITQNMK